MATEALLKVKELKKHFDLGKNGLLKAVDGVSFEIYKGETLGLVGESGCGKSTTGRTVMGMYNNTDGDVHYEGKNVQQMTEKERFSFLRNMQMIFQDPYASLNPRSTVLELISELMGIHNLHKNKGEMKKTIPVC
ncbi:oligopeptide/dipeptide ABC transporter, ATP-binding protein domain protein [Jeotgalibacillus campisalis]|uniref:Oligopeptide/dipeptide ABC transporter, ATP-binding protein domain protein n=1 Tax=Jeotgalibacillus campisalis TaxID=220754 RepID=A0A0C2SG05_9BACL|nr:oligopeptide/dipeptide ABC transporter, ATP-binding protein domain protein [Jeotgalibacillus campisalis]